MNNIIRLICETAGYEITIGKASKNWYVHLKDETETDIEFIAPDFQEALTNAYNWILETHRKK